MKMDVFLCRYCASCVSCHFCLWSNDTPVHISIFSLDGLCNPTAITGGTGDNLDSPMSAFIYLFSFSLSFASAFPLDDFRVGTIRIHFAWSSHVLEMHRLS
jgi:hypothetical protein